MVEAPRRGRLLALSALTRVFDATTARSRASSTRLERAFVWENGIGGMLSRTCPTCARELGLSNSASVGDRTGVMLEPLAQLDKLRLVGQEVPVVFHHLVGKDRFVAGRRRN